VGAADFDQLQPRPGKRTRHVAPTPTSTTTLNNSSRAHGHSLDQQRHGNTSFTTCTGERQKQLEIKELQRVERVRIYERVEANAASPRKAAGTAKMRTD